MIARVTMVASLLVLALLVEGAILPTFAIRGWQPDLLALVVVAFGLADGPETGLRVGFSAGLVHDLVTGGPLVGLGALLLLAVGYVAGAARPYAVPAGAPGQVVLAGAAVATSVLVGGGLAATLGAGAGGFGRAVEGAVVVGLYSAVLAPLVCRLVGRLSRRFTGSPAAGLDLP